MARGPDETAAGSIARQLAAPADRPDLDALAARWFPRDDHVRQLSGCVTADAAAVSKPVPPQTRRADR